MPVGDYAHQGSVNISIIDTDSSWIDGYFEEPKLARVCIGDRVEEELIGYAKPILGHVVRVTRGIGVSDAAAGTQGLPNVYPVFSWVRLAQRVGSRRDRSGSGQGSARLGLKRDRNDRGRSRRCQYSIIIVARSRRRADGNPIVGCPEWPGRRVRMHSEDDHGASNPRIHTGGYGELAGHS